MRIEYTARITGEDIDDLIRRTKERADAVFGEHPYKVDIIDFFTSQRKNGPNFEAYIRIVGKGESDDAGWV